MAIVHTSNDGTNAILAIILVLVALILGFFLFRGIGTTNRSSTIDVNIPNIPGTTNDTSGGGTTGQ